jgi:hypothetical protein
MTKPMPRQIQTPALTPVPLSMPLSMPLSTLRQFLTPAPFSMPMPLSIQRPIPHHSSPSSSPATVSASPAPIAVPR